MTYKGFSTIYDETLTRRFLNSYKLKVKTIINKAYEAYDNYKFFIGVFPAQKANRVTAQSRGTSVELSA